MNMTIMAIVLLLFMALLNGCASGAGNLQHNVKLYKTSEIKAGKSTKEEVRALLGPPDTVTSDATGNEIWSYAAKELSPREKASMVGTMLVLSPLLAPANPPIPSLKPDKKCEIYFDNEGHTINYTVANTADSIILPSVPMKDMPVFRLTYTWLGQGLVNTKFEMSQDGKNFMTYVEGKSVKTN